MDDQDSEGMDEQEFGRLLDLFPVVRTRDYVADEDRSKRSPSDSSQDVALREWQDAWDEGDRKELERGGIDQHDAFWEKLKFAAEKKVGGEEAERFCKAFQKLHRKLVFEELSTEAARNFINSPSSSRK